MERPATHISESFKSGFQNKSEQERRDHRSTCKSNKDGSRRWLITEYKNKKCTEQKLRAPNATHGIVANSKDCASKFSTALLSDSLFQAPSEEENAAFSQLAAL